MDFVIVITEGDGYSTPYLHLNLLPGLAPPSQILLSYYEEGKSNTCFVDNSRRKGPISFNSSQLPGGPEPSPSKAFSKHLLRNSAECSGSSRGHCSNLLCSSPSSFWEGLPCWGLERCGDVLSKCEL